MKLCHAHSAGIFPHWSRVHTRQGFHLGLWSFLNPLLILRYSVCVEVSPLCSLPTTVYAAVGSVVYQVALLPSNNGLRHSEQYLLYIRSLCSLPTLIVCTVVSQVALLPSYNSKATVSLLCSLPVSILFQFFPIYLNLF